MNRIILTATAAVIAFAGAASAMTEADGVFVGQLAVVAPGVDAHALSNEQIRAIESALAGIDSPAELRAYITSVVNG
jgi:hypothetical protein